MIHPKPLFLERMKKLQPNEKDFQSYLEFATKRPQNSIRCNTLKITEEKLKERLEEKGWKISQPYPEHKEIMIVEKESNLKPGELGKAIEHILGYYYVQEISSMMPPIALNPKDREIVLDLCASPGSKTTQISAMMSNQGTIIANDKDIGRISILNANIERCSCSNVIITRHDGVQLCERLKRIGIKFDKILLDLPCSGEGNTRSNEKTFLMWNIKMIEKLSRLQRKLASSSIPLLKEGGELVYSTCTHSPEANEDVVSFLCKNFNLEILKAELPLKYREGIKEWKEKEFCSGIENCCRIHPQDNNTEGFFLAKMRKKDYQKYP